jgi:hypothetical protein
MKKATKIVCLMILMISLVMTPVIVSFANTSNHSMLMVLQPNGGEMWGSGETHIIAWASGGLNPQGRIFIYVGDEGNWSKIAGPMPVTLNAWSWNIKDPGCTHAKIKVVCYVESNCQIMDISNGYITLTGTKPTLQPPTLITPLNNTIEVSTKPTFTWEANTMSYSYRLQISRYETFTDIYMDRWIIDDTSYKPEYSLPDDSKLYWRVASYDSSGNPSLWSYPWSFSTGRADNADFFMANGKVTTENGYLLDDVYMDFVCQHNSKHQPQPVLTDYRGYWTQTGFESGYTYKVIPSKPGYTFDPPQMFIEQWNSSDINFTAKSILSGSITVAWPNGMETIKAGEEKKILWTSTNLNPKAKIYISLIKSIGPSELIAGPISSNTRSFTWIVPNYEIHMAKIRIECREDDKLTAIDESDWWFKISKEPQIQLRPSLTSPLNGQQWVSTHPTLYWEPITSYDNYQVQLSDNPYFTNLIIDRYTTNTWVNITPSLNYGMKYYWRVKAFNNATNDTTEWSYWNHFTTGYEREEETWQAQGWVEDDNGNPVYGCMISFVSLSGNASVPAVAVTNDKGFWSQTGFVCGEEYKVYPAIQGVSFSPSSMVISESVSSSINFTAFGLGSSADLIVRSPEAGSYKRGTTQSISWSVNSIPEDAVFYISLMHDGKVTQIDGPLPSYDRHKVWTVPDIITNDARIRVQAWRNAQIIAEAKGPTFSITGP